jgi:hypothetical protein
MKQLVVASLLLAPNAAFAEWKVEQNAKKLMSLRDDPTGTVAIVTRKHECRSSG